MTNLMFAILFFLLTAIIVAPHIGYSAAILLGLISLAAGFLALYQWIKK